jgi:hypothetical protein
MHPIHLDTGGPAWAGWTFGRYGRARDWRLFAPDGTHYQAAELAELRALVLDVDYLRMRVRELEARLDPGACVFSAEELRAVRQAVAALQRVLPASGPRGLALAAPAALAEAAGFRARR